MRTPPIIIFPGDNGWKIARGDLLIDVPKSAGSDPAQIARELSTLIGSSEANVTLAIPSAWCISATISLDGIPNRNRRSALLYRLELLLPLTAEDIAADYIFNEPHNVLAICVSIATLQGVINAIEEAGILVQSIVPGSICAVSAMIQEKQEMPDGVIWQSGDTLEIFVIQNGIIAGWCILPAEVADLRWHFDHLFADRSIVRNITVYNLSQPLDEDLKSIPSIKLSSDNLSIEQAAITGMTNGLLTPVELRRDGLAPGNPLRTIRRPVIEFAVAAVLLIACICGAACWRASRLERLASNYRTRQEQVFHEAFPGHAIPANIVSRLRSEERKLQSGDSDSNDSLPQSTLPTLQSVLLAVNSLPPEARIEVNDLKVNDNKITIDGMVRNRTDLAAVVDALQQLSHLQLDAPQTEQLPGKGIHITLTGTGAGEPKSR